jgi:hypothetical protein
MGDLFVPMLVHSNKLRCAACGHTMRSGVLRFDGGRSTGYLCHTCAENSGESVASPWQPRSPLLPVSVRIHAWPVLALFLTAVGAVAVVLLLSALAWTALRTILLLLSSHS